MGLSPIYVLQETLPPSLKSYREERLFDVSDAHRVHVCDTSRPQSSPKKEDTFDEGAQMSPIKELPELEIGHRVLQKPLRSKSG